MRSARGANLRAIPTAPGTEQSDAAPDLNQADAQSVNSGIDDLENLPEAPPVARPVSQAPSNATVKDDSDLDALPSAAGNLGQVYGQVSHANIDPDRAAQVVDASNKTGQDPALVDANLAEARKTAAAPDANFFKSIEDRYPGTTKFLQSPQNMAVAHDDLPNVAQHEGLIQTFKDTMANEKNAAIGGSLQEELAYVRYQQMMGEQTPQSDPFRVGGMVANEMGAPTGNIKERADWIQSRLDEINKTKPGPGQNWLKRGLYGAAEFSPMIASGLMTGTKYAAGLAAPIAAAGLATGPADIPITAAAVGIGLGAGEADYNYHLMAGMAYDNLQKVRDTNGQPLPDNVMKLAAISTGVVGAGLSMVKLGALLESIPGGKEYLEKFTSSVPAEVLQTSATRSAALKTFAQSYVTAVAHGTAAMTGLAAVNILGERGAESASGQTFDHSQEPGIASQLAQSAADAAMTFGVMGVVGPTVGLGSDLANARKAETAKNFYVAMGDTAEASKLRQRLPEAHQELIKGLTQDGPVENVYIPQEAFQSYFQSKDADPETVAGELGIQDSYREALQTGGDVKIPLDVWASRVAGTEHYQGLAGDIKFNPEDLTANEVEKRRADIKEQIKEVEAQAQAGGDGISTPEESGQKIYDERHQQLIDAGVSETEAKQGATLHREAFKSLAERTGQDPYELSQRFKLEMQRREAPETVETGANSLNQGSDRPLQTDVPLPTEVKVTRHNGGIPTIKEAKANLKELRDKSVTNEHTGWDVEIKRGGIDKSGTTLASEANRVAASHLEELIRSAVYSRDEADKLGGENNLHVLYAPFRDGAKEYTVKITLRDGPNGKKLYDKFALENKDSATAFATPDQTGSQEAADAVEDKPQTISIDDFMHHVNGLQAEDPFFQTGDAPRGRISFQDHKAVINLFKDANRSTFLHESGHYFLQIMQSLAADENAPQSVKDDVKAIREWMGLKDGEAIGVPQHEQFARGFEAYLMEGKAPSEALRSAFAKFKQWLVTIYKGVKGLDVELSPQIREVMDRMLATEDEIKKAHSDVGFDQSKGMQVPESLKGQMNSLAEQARDKAESTLMREQMKEISENNKSFLSSEKSRLRSEGEALAEKEPVFKAQNDIQEALGTRRKVLNVASKMLDGSIKADDALHFETAAEVNGFADGKSLANEILASAANGAKEKIIQAHVDEGMAPHANMMDKSSIKIEALKAIHNDHMTELLALERQIFANKVNEADVNQEVSKRQRIEARIAAFEAKAQAKQILDAKPIKEAGNFRTYTTAERNAAIKADAAIRRKDFARASEYKRQQMLNHALAAEAMRNRDEVESSVKYLENASKRGADLKDMPFAFNRQVDQLLEKFGLKEKTPEDTKTLTQIAKDMQAKGESADDIANATGLIIDPQSGILRAETIRDFIARVNENYVGMQLPENILSGAGVDDYKDLKMIDLRDLKSAVKTLAEVGKRYDRFLSDFIKVGIKEAAAAFKASVLENIGAPYADNRKIGSKYSSPLREKIENLKNIPDAMISTMVNALTTATYLDGGEANGPAHDYIYRPLKQAEDRKFARYAKMREELTGKDGLFAKFYEPKELADYKNKAVKYGDRTLTKENILSMALNWGNESNRDRIRAGFGSRDESGRLVPMSDADIQGLFDKHLAKKDWDFAQAAWDHLDSYWPEIAALEMKIKGVEPERVTPLPFDNQHGSYQGGYYPIAYDFEKSSEAFKNEAQKNELYKQYSAASAQTETGHTVARTSFVARPVRLSMDVFFNHLENVIHDLEFRPAVIDVNKFMNMPEVKSSIENAIGLDAKRGMDNWLQSIASDQSENLTWIEKALTWTRFGTTISALGLTPKAFLLHLPSNVFNSMWETGVQNTVRVMTGASLDVAMGRGELKDFVFERSERMKQRLTVRDRDIMDMSRAWQGTSAGVIPHYAFMALHLADEAVSVPLWADAYKKNVAEFGEQKASDIADETVTRTLGSGSKVDQIGLQRGGGAKKLFTMFYSWMSVMFNRAWLDGKMAGLEYSKGNVGSAVGIIAKASFFAWALPAVHEALLQEAMHNGQSSDDDRNKRMAGTIIGHPFAMIPFVRDIAQPMIHTALGEHGTDYKISPVEMALQNIYKPTADGARIAFTDDKHFDEKFAEEAARGLSQVAGYPQQLNSWAFNLLDYVEGSGELTMKSFLSRQKVLAGQD